MHVNNKDVNLSTATKQATKNIELSAVLEIISWRFTKLQSQTCSLMSKKQKELLAVAE